MYNTLCSTLNDLLRDWHLRTKYVDDTTVLEVIPRNSLSMLDIVVRDIHEYCVSHKMKLNPKKCKEMVINFIANPSIVIRPTCTENQAVETVTTCKLLGVTIREDLKWNSHVHYFIAKVAKRLLCPKTIKTRMRQPT